MQHTAPTPRLFPDLAVRTPMRRPVLSFSGLSQTVRAVTKRLQHGRMISVLMRLSGARPARIGIIRARIPAHARGLVCDEAPAPRSEDLR